MFFSEILKNLQVQPSGETTILKNGSGEAGRAYSSPKTWEVTVVSLTSLWLPILLSSVFVFVASSLIHMVLQYHKNDYKKLANEDGVLEAMRKDAPPPGQYVFPCAASWKEAGTPEMVKKYQEGPCGFMTVVPNGTPKMAKNLILWFFYSVLISVFAAYICGRNLPAGTEYITVFRFTGAVAVLGYAAGYLPYSIWWGVPWKTTFTAVIDGIIFGLLTAGTFGWLWPD